jgi:hypothetical protein
LELANISAIFKTMLVAQNGFVMSAGLGVTAPTAQDVRYTVDLQNVFITYATLDPPLGVLSNYDVETHFTNETWYLSPFLAWACRNDSRFFHQGFLQVEMAANPSRVRLTDNGSFGVVTYDPFNPNPAPDFGVIWTIDGQVGGSTLVDLNAQPIMRLNLGGGYYLIDQSDNHNFFDELVAMFELHYTTTLQDSKPSPIPLGFIQVDLGGDLSQNIDAFDPTVGNLNSRIDILNAVMGVSATVHGTVVTNGFTVPLRTGDNRGFDFEYNLQIQRPF